ncbi:MAG: ABC transporter ATP-binding protein [Lamprobacter sp.]|uniref:ABC transporter ATP-binding protein n=1 Tax=Lamprobacter sp. TaxID=3100796 RepID=UPI002B25662B|nr:ABC transporter ATP-binding protein [Lamprobacter sp.]MEA3642881.1 ABC transporter ATP-binding protein [Lamprobacter sp.]
MTHDRPDAIVVEGLTKGFDRVEAVAGIAFRVHQGELFGFLGPNGAGKSTTINLLTGLARPDAGSIRLGGIDCTRRARAAQHLIGVVPDESNLYPELSGRDNLSFCGALYGLPKRERKARARELLEAFGLSEAAGRKFGGYSKGMKRRLTIAAGIIHRPQILFLDEPTTGLDVASARQLRQLITELHRAGTTIFLTTHYIEEAERLCERIAFIVSGQIVRIDSIAQLLEPLQDRQRVRITSRAGLNDVPGGLNTAFPELDFSCPEPGVLQAETEAGAALRVGAIVRWLEEQGIEVLEARRLRPSLEEVFVRVTGIATDAMRQERERAGGGQ